MAAAAHLIYLRLHNQDPVAVGFYNLPPLEDAQPGMDVDTFVTLAWLLSSLDREVVLEGGRAHLYDLQMQLYSGHEAGPLAPLQLAVNLEAERLTDDWSGLAMPDKLRGIGAFIINLAVRERMEQAEGLEDMTAEAIVAAVLTPVAASLGERGPVTRIRRGRPVMAAQRDDTPAEGVQQTAAEFGLHPDQLDDLLGDYLTQHPAPAADGGRGVPAGRCHPGRPPCRAGDRTRRGHAGAAPRRIARRRRAEGAVGPQSAPGGQYRQEIHQYAAGRPDLGGQYRPDARHAQVQRQAWPPLLDLCDLVDPAGDYPSDCGQFAHDPHAGARRRDHDQDPPCAGAAAGRPVAAGLRGDRRAQRPHGG